MLFVFFGNEKYILFNTISILFIINLDYIFDILSVILHRLYRIVRGN